VEFQVVVAVAEHAIRTHLELEVREATVDVVLMPRMPTAAVVVVVWPLWVQLVPAWVETAQELQVETAVLVSHTTTGRFYYSVVEEVAL
jgi:hypothetical protein